MPSLPPRTITTHVVLHCCPTGVEALNIGAFELAGGGGELRMKIAKALDISTEYWKHNCVCNLANHSRTIKKVPINVLLDLIANEGYELKTMSTCPYDTTKDEGLTYTFVKVEIQSGV